MKVSDIFEAWADKFYGSVLQDLNITQSTTLIQLFNQLKQKKYVDQVFVEPDPTVPEFTVGSAAIGRTPDGKQALFLYLNPNTRPSTPVIKMPTLLSRLRHELAHTQQNKVLWGSSKKSERISSLQDKYVEPVMSGGLNLTNLEYRFQPIERGNAANDVAEALSILNLTPNHFKRIVNDMSEGAEYVITELLKIPLSHVNFDVLLGELGQDVMKQYINLHNVRYSNEELIDSANMVLSIAMVVAFFKILKKNISAFGVEDAAQFRSKFAQLNNYVNAFMRTLHKNYNKVRAYEKGRRTLSDNR